MNWNKGNKELLKNIEHVNTGKWVLNLLQRNYEYQYDGDEELSDEDSTINVEYVPVVVNDEPIFNVIKDALIGLQIEYDNSKSVNVFTINGISSWMDKNTRNALRSTLNIVEKTGAQEYTVWVENNPLTIDIQLAKDFLDALELYAILCYLVTSTHLSNINNILNVEDLFTYDITTGYPQPLNISI